jgi:hypothetical protein
MKRDCPIGFSWSDKSKSKSSFLSLVYDIKALRDLFFATPARLKFLRSDKQELSSCKEVVKKIAISYGASWYNDLSNHPDPNFAKMLGRVKFVKILNDDFSLDAPWQEIKLHLLGCQLPQEFSYHYLNCIETIDTSNPILAAIDGMKYNPYGLISKPKTRIDDIIKIPFSKLDLDLTLYNVNLFRKINNI